MGEVGGGTSGRVVVEKCRSDWSRRRGGRRHGGVWVDVDCVVSGSINVNGSSRAAATAGSQSHQVGLT